MELFRAFGRLALEGQDIVNRGLDAFERAGRRAGERMRQLGDRMTNLGRSMRSVVSTGVAAATGALSYFSITAANVGREITYLARDANMGTTEFQRWAAAGQTVGLEMDKVGDILRDVQDKIGDYLTTGAGGAVDFFEQIAPRIGLTAEAFRGLSGGEALQLYYRSLERANVSQAEMVFYMEALASDASRLAPLLANNGDELARLGREAEQSGAILSEVQLEALAALSAEMTRFRNAITGARNEIGAAFAPVLTSILEIIREDFLPILQRLTGYIAQAGEWFSGLSRRTQFWAIAIGGAAVALGPLIIGLGLFIAAAGALIPALVAATPAILAFVAGFLIGKAAVWAIEQGIRLVGQAIEWLGTKWTEGLAAVTAWAQGVAQVFSDVIAAVLQWFSELPDRIVGFIRGMVQSVLNWIGSMVDGIISRLQRLYDVVVGNSIIPDLADDVVSVVGGMADGSISETERMAAGMEGAMPRDGFDALSGPVLASRGAGAGGTTIDMRNSIIRDDRDMLERMRQRGLVPQGVF